MTWLTWKQFRAQAATAGAAMVAFAILLAATAPHLASLYAASRIAGCHGDACGTAATNFLNRLVSTSPYPDVFVLGMALILAAPAVIGIFWGAPLIAREVETGTSAVAWNQSITRAQWLAVKLALTGLAAMAVTEALSLMYAWWADPISKAIGLGASQSWNLPSLFSHSRFGLLIFPTSGIAPLGYAAFGFALGTATGALIRRAVPAMAVTLAIFAAVQVAVPLWVRPHLIPPERTVAVGPMLIDAAGLNYANMTASAVRGHPGAWITSSGAINAAGQSVSTLPVACQPPPPAKPPSPWQCMASRGIREAITYQPASRYWPLQWIETGIYLALALALAWFCFWRLGRRRT